MIELRLPVDAGLADELEAHFCEDHQVHWMLHENWKTHEHELRGFFERREEMATDLERLRARFPALAGEPELRELADRDWKEAYKLHFKPWHERGLHWVPVWEKDTYKLPPGEEIVYLDPGMAFGTGNHETTRLCVRRLLDARDEWGPKVPEKRVLDAGCGSGILAISARKLGFRDIFAFDNDPDAVRISLDNAQLCSVADLIEFKWADLSDGLFGRSADLLLANILSPVLCAHAHLLAGAVRPGGRLVLSGILDKEKHEVHATFAKALGEPDLSLDSQTDGDWADLCYEIASE